MGSRFGSTAPSKYGLDDVEHRYAPMKVLITGHGTVPVVSSRVHSPGTHPNSAIVSDLTALELVTPYGSRWYGVRRAYINSELKMVVVGTNPHDEVRMKWPIVPRDRRA